MSGVFLATTGAASFWDTRRRVVFLGDWCLREEHRAVWDAMPRDVLPFPWDDLDAFDRACGTVRETYERALSWLGGRLAQHHAVSDDPRYWRTVIGPWLFRFVHGLYDRYCGIAQALALHPDLNTWTLAADSHVIPFDTSDFIELIVEDQYNLQIYTQILTELGRSFPPRPWPEATGYRRRVARRGALRTFAAAASRRMPRRAALVDLYCPLRDQLALSAASGFSLLPVEFPPVPDPGSPAGDRSCLEGFPGQGEFDRIVRATLPTAVPRIHVESFPSARRMALARTASADVVASAAGWHTNELFKLFAAESARQGSRLIAVQHGGGYGTFRDIPTEEHEAKVADTFVTWGWRGHGSFCAAPSPQLARCLRAAQRQGPAQGIVLLGTLQPRYLYQFQSMPHGSQWTEYLESQMAFIEALGPVGADLRLRSYMRDYGHGVRAKYARRFPTLSFDRHRTGVEAMRAARLVVFDHAVTGFLESFVLNRPTILFWNPQQWRVREAAAADFEALRAAGILFDSAADAANAVRAVYDTAEEWWLAAAVQKARADFIARYAMASPDWVRVWRQLLQPSTVRHAGVVRRDSGPLR